MIAVIVIGLYRLMKQVLWKKFCSLLRLSFHTGHNDQPICRQQRHLPNRNHWCSCHTRKKSWLATHSPYKIWQYGQRQGNDTILHTQFCPLLSHIDISQSSYTSIKLLHVATTIVRHLSTFFSSMEQQLQKGKFPIMLFKNITKKRDVKERIFRTTQATFVTEL
jgi:hypothetical protein